MADRNFFSCELCGLTLAENFELMKVSSDTLLDNYADTGVAESGAHGGLPEDRLVNLCLPAAQLCAPFNTSDLLVVRRSRLVGVKYAENIPQCCASAGG